MTSLPRGFGRGDVQNGRIGDNAVKASDEKVRQMAVNLKTDETGIRQMINSLGEQGGKSPNVQNSRYSRDVQLLIDNSPDYNGGRYGQINRAGRGGSNVGWQRAIDTAVFSGDLDKANQLVRQARQHGVRVITPEQRAKIAQNQVNFQKRIDASVLEKSAELEDLQRQIYVATGELRELERTIQIDNEFRNIKIGLDGKIEVTRIADALKGKSSIAAQELKAQIAQAQLLGQNITSLSRIVESGGKYLRVTVDADGNVKEQKVKKLEAKIEQAVERLQKKQLEHFQRTGEMKSFKEKIKVGGKKFEITLRENGEVKVKQKKSFFQKAFGFIGKFLFPVLSIATMLIPGLQPIALGLKIFGAIKGGVESIIGKNWMGLIGSTLGAFSGGLASTLQKGFSVVQTGYNVVKNGIKSVWDGLGAVAGVVSNLSSGNLSKVANYFGAGAGIIGGIEKGDIGGALLGIGNLVGGEVKTARLTRNLERFQKGLEIPNASFNELKATYNFRPEDLAVYNAKREVAAQTQSLTPSLDQVISLARSITVNPSGDDTAKSPNSLNHEVVELMRQNAARRGLTPEQTEIYIAQGLKLADETKEKSTTQLALESAARRNLTPEQTIEYLKQGERLLQETTTKSPTILAFEAAERRGMNPEQTIAYINQGEQFAQESKNLLVNAGRNSLLPTENKAIGISDTPGLFVQNGITYSTNLTGNNNDLLSDRIIIEKGETKNDAVERYFNIKLSADGKKGTHTIIYGKNYGNNTFDAWIVPNGVNDSRPSSLSPELKLELSKIESNLYANEQNSSKGNSGVYNRQKLRDYLSKSGLPESYVSQILNWNAEIAERATKPYFEARKQTDSTPQANTLSSLQGHITSLKLKDKDLNDNLAFYKDGLDQSQYQSFDIPRLELKQNTAKVERIATTLGQLQEMGKNGTVPTAQKLTEFNNALSEARGLGLISDSLYTQLDGVRKTGQQQVRDLNRQTIESKPQESSQNGLVKLHGDVTSFLATQAGNISKGLQDFSQKNAGSSNPFVSFAAGATQGTLNVADTVNYGFRGLNQTYSELLAEDPNNFILQAGSTFANLGKDTFTPLTLLAPSSTQQERVEAVNSLIVDAISGKVLGIVAKTPLGQKVVKFLDTDINPFNRPRAGSLGVVSPDGKVSKISQNEWDDAVQVKLDAAPPDIPTKIADDTRRAVVKLTTQKEGITYDLNTKQIVSDSKVPIRTATPTTATGQASTFDPSTIKPSDVPVTGSSLYPSRQRTGTGVVGYKMPDNPNVQIVEYDILGGVDSPVDRQLNLINDDRLNTLIRASDIATPVTFKNGETVLANIVEVKGKGIPTLGEIAILSEVTGKEVSLQTKIGDPKSVIMVIGEPERVPVLDGYRLVIHTHKSSPPSPDDAGFGQNIIIPTERPGEIFVTPRNPTNGMRPNSAREIPVSSSIPSNYQTTKTDRDAIPASYNTTLYDYEAVAGGYGLNYTKAAVQIEAAKNANAQLRTIPTEDLVALQAYTEARGYTSMNGVLRKDPALTDSQNTQTAILIKGATSALNQLPSYKGTVFTGLTMTPQEIAEFKPGLVFPDGAFRSSTSDSSKAFRGNVLYVIESKKGKAISEISSAPNESEVLFRPNTKFQVLKVETQKTDFPGRDAVIYLREVE
ncbi:MAG: hypothetical protein H7Z37_10220 [Pyrinomonadaceae bacterium]|nr:hypothetical protein [Pyrinomonadaceae bacterium]